MSDTNSLRVLTDQLGKSLGLTQIKVFTDSYKAVMEPYKQITQGMAKIVSDIYMETEIFRKMAQDIHDTINTVVPDLQKTLTQSIEPFIKYHQAEKEVLLNSGWFVCPSLFNMPATIFRPAVIASPKNQSRTVTVLMKQIYGNNNWQKLGNTIDTWSHHRFFTKNRMRIINDAFEAHQNGKYTLTIPALLPIVEGICGDYCKEQSMGGNSAKVPVSKPKRKAEIMLKGLNTKGQEYVGKLLSEYMLNQLYTRSDELKLPNNRNHKNKKYMNRHTILHGVQTGYADCARSLRCFLLLDVLTLL